VLLAVDSRPCSEVRFEVANSRRNAGLSQVESTALGNNGNNSRQVSRNEALALREILWRVSSIEDFRKCGRVPNSVYFPVVETPHGYRLRGLCRCHSIWCCPVCAPSIRAARGDELSRAVSRHLLTDGSVTFGSATVPHEISHRLKGSLSVVMKAWDRANRNNAVVRFREAHGWLGFCRACEVTHGPNGWHPHLHWLDLWRGVLGDVEADYQEIFYNAWASGVVGLGMKCPSREHGVKILRVGEDFETDYMFKLTPKAAGFELTSLTTKVARSKNLAPFDLLRLAGTGDAYWLKVWHEYESGTRGRRMLGWSRGLRSSLGVALKDPDVERMPYLEVGNVDAFSMEFLRHTAGGMLGVHAAIEAAAVDGQIGIDAAVALMLNTRAGFKSPDDFVALSPSGEVCGAPVAAQLAFWGS